MVLCGNSFKTYSGVLYGSHPRPLGARRRRVAPTARGVSQVDLTTA